MARSCDEVFQCLSIGKRSLRSRSKYGSEGCPGGGNREPLTGLEQMWREAPRKKVAAFKVGLFACQMGSL